MIRIICNAVHNALLFYERTSQLTAPTTQPPGIPYPPNNCRTGAGGPPPTAPTTQPPGISYPPNNCRTGAGGPPPTAPTTQPPGISYPPTTAVLEQEVHHLLPLPPNHPVSPIHQQLPYWSRRSTTYCPYHPTTRYPLSPNNCRTGAGGPPPTAPTTQPPGISYPPTTALLEQEVHHLLPLPPNHPVSPIHQQLPYWSRRSTTYCPYHPTTGYLLSPNNCLTGAGGPPPTAPTTQPPGISYPPTTAVLEQEVHHLLPLPPNHPVSPIPQQLPYWSRRSTTYCPYHPTTGYLLSTNNCRTAAGGPPPTAPTTQPPGISYPPNNCRTGAGGPPPTAPTTQPPGISYPPTTALLEQEVHHLLPLPPNHRVSPIPQQLPYWSRRSTTYCPYHPTTRYPLSPNNCRTAAGGPPPPAPTTQPPGISYPPTTALLEQEVHHLLPLPPNHRVSPIHPTTAVLEQEVHHLLPLPPNHRVSPIPQQLPYWSRRSTTYCPYHPTTRYLLSTNNCRTGAGGPPPTAPTTQPPGISYPPTTALLEQEVHHLLPLPPNHPVSPIHQQLPYWSRRSTTYCPYHPTTRYLLSPNNCLTGAGGPPPTAPTTQPPGISYPPTTAVLQQEVHHLLPLPPNHRVSPIHPTTAVLEQEVHHLLPLPPNHRVSPIPQQLPYWSRRSTTYCPYHPTTGYPLSPNNCRTGAGGPPPTAPTTQPPGIPYPPTTAVLQQEVHHLLLLPPNHRVSPIPQQLPYWSRRSTTYCPYHPTTGYLLSPNNCLTGAGGPPPTAPTTQPPGIPYPPTTAVLEQEVHHLLPLPPNHPVSPITQQLPYWSRRSTTYCPYHPTTGYLLSTNNCRTGAGGPPPTAPTTQPPGISYPPNNCRTGAGGPPPTAPTTQPPGISYPPTTAVLEQEVHHLLPLPPNHRVSPIPQQLPYWSRRSTTYCPYHPTTRYLLSPNNCRTGAGGPPPTAPTTQPPGIPYPPNNCRTGAGGPPPTAPTTQPPGVSYPPTTVVLEQEVHHLLPLPPNHPVSPIPQQLPYWSRRSTTYCPYHPTTGYLLSTQQLPYWSRRSTTYCPYHPTTGYPLSTNNCRTGAGGPPPTAPTTQPPGISYPPTTAVLEQEVHHLLPLPPNHPVSPIHPTTAVLEQEVHHLLPLPPNHRVSPIPQQLPYWSRRSTTYCPYHPTTGYLLSTQQLPYWSRRSTTYCPYHPTTRYLLSPNNCRTGAGGPPPTAPTTQPPGIPYPPNNCRTGAGGPPPTAPTTQPPGIPYPPTTAVLEQEVHHLLPLPPNHPVSPIPQQLPYWSRRSTTYCPYHPTTGYPLSPNNCRTGAGGPPPTAPTTQPPGISYPPTTAVLEQEVHHLLPLPPNHRVSPIPQQLPYWSRRSTTYCPYHPTTGYLLSTQQLPYWSRRSTTYCPYHPTTRYPLSPNNCRTGAGGPPPTAPTTQPPGISYPPTTAVLEQEVHHLLPLPPNHRVSPIHPTTAVLEQEVHHLLPLPPNHPVSPIPQQLPYWSRRSTTYCPYHPTTRYPLSTQQLPYWSRRSTTYCPYHPTTRYPLSPNNCRTGAGGPPPTAPTTQPPGISYPPTTAVLEQEVHHLLPLPPNHRVSPIPQQLPYWSRRSTTYCPYHPTTGYLLSPNNCRTGAGGPPPTAPTTQPPGIPYPPTTAVLEQEVHHLLPLPPNHRVSPIHPTTAVLEQEVHHLLPLPPNHPVSPIHPTTAVLEQEVHHLLPLPPNHPVSPIHPTTAVLEQEVHHLLPLPPNHPVSPIHQQLPYWSRRSTTYCPYHPTTRYLLSPNNCCTGAGGPPPTAPTTQPPGIPYPPTTAVLEQEVHHLLPLPPNHRVSPIPQQLPRRGGVAADEQMVRLRFIDL